MVRKGAPEGGGVVALLGGDQCVGFVWGWRIVLGGV